MKQKGYFYQCWIGVEKNKENPAIVSRLFVYRFSTIFTFSYFLLLNTESCCAFFSGYFATFPLHYCCFHWSPWATAWHRGTAQWTVHGRTDPGGRCWGGMKEGRVLPNTWGNYLGPDFQKWTPKAIQTLQSYRKSIWKLPMILPSEIWSEQCSGNRIVPAVSI